MKHLILLFSTFLLFNTSQAQKRVYKDFEFGLRGGINVSGLRGSFPDSMDANYKVGFQFGVFSRYHISNKFITSFEILFTRKGFKANVLDTFTLATLIYVENHYNIEFPLMLEYRLSNESSLELGASYGLNLINDKVNFPGFNPFTENTADLSALIGFNYFIDEITTLGFRYNYGLNPIIETASKQGYSSNFQILIKSKLF